MRLIGATVAILVLVSAVTAQDANKKEMALLDGTWSMVSGQADGQDMPKQLVDGGKRIAKDGEVTIMIGGQVYFKAKFTIDPAKKPKTIDYVMTEGFTKGKTQLGIYELDGDTIKFCFAAPGKDRPKDFTAKQGSQQTFSVWKRDKSPEKPTAIPTAILKQTQPIFDGESLDGWVQVPADSWVVKDAAMASTGAGRGVIYTKDDYTKYRFFFTMRHVSGQPDHQACVLIFCTRPEDGKKPLDALAGVQFQVPLGGHWDYRPGQNKAGTGFTRTQRPKFDPHEWSQVEMLVDATTGKARMAVAQPVGSKAVEVLSFNVPEAGKVGPIAWQMHNKGLFDEYKDVRIEINPKDELLTTK